MLKIQRIKDYLIYFSSMSQPIILKAFIKVYDLARLNLYICKQ